MDICGYYILTFCIQYHNRIKENPIQLTLKKYDRRRENSRQMTSVGYLGLSSLTFNSISMRGRVSQLSQV